MTTLKTIMFSSLAFGLGLAALAQQPDGISVQRQAYGIALEDGVLWGLGPDYKASFTQGGMEYVPALGEKAPRNQPLRITLQSITRGGLVLYEADPGRHPAAVRDGESVIYRRTSDILEKFQVRADGVELSYTFANPLSGTGDLVVRARIDTDLVLQPDAEDGARFVLDGIGGVTIGAVTGVDAFGSATPGDMRCAEGWLELTLPTRFVDDAAYPLVLDPLVGTEFQVGGARAREPAVAYDRGTQSYLVAWQMAMSGTDSDIRAQHVSQAGNLLGSLIPLANSPGIELRPTVANVKARRRFLVTWQRSISPFGPWDLECRAVDALFGTTSTTRPVHVVPGVDQTDPDSAGDNSNSDKVLVVWSQEGQGIKGTTITVPASGDPIVPNLSPPQTITADVTASEPAISKSGSSTSISVVVWRRPMGSMGSIMAQAVDRTMTLQGPALQVAVSVASGIAFYRPAVDGDGLDFMVAWDRPGSGSTDRDVWCRTIRWNGGRLLQTSLPTTVAGDPKDEYEPAVGWLNGKYVVLWTGRNTSVSGYDYDIEGAELGPTCQTCGQSFRLLGLNSTTSHDMEMTPDIATRRAGGDFASDQAMIVFCEASSLPPFNSDVVAQSTEAFGGGATQDLGGGCGNGGTAGVASPAAIGNGDFGLTLSGAATSATFMTVGINFVNTALPCGPCTVMSTPNWFITFPSGPGRAGYPLGVPCDPSFAGLPVYSQWAVFFSGASPCPLAPAAAQISFSNRFRAVVDF